MAVDRTTSDARPLDQLSAHGEAVDQEAADREAALWADLASNAIVLANATEDRCRLLVARARLWDQLADLSTRPAGAPTATPPSRAVPKPPATAHAPNPTRSADQRGPGCHPPHTDRLRTDRVHTAQSVHSLCAVHTVCAGEVCRAPAVLRRRRGGR